MFSSSTAAPRFEPKRWSKSFDIFVLTALFCALLAAILTLASPSFSGFARWLLISECIGFSGVLCAMLAGQLPWLRRLRPVAAHICISFVSVPVGYIAGSSLAYTLLGEPIPILAQGPRKVIALVATALATVFIVYLDSMRTRIAVEAAARSDLQRLAVESQLRLLRAQLDPHMVFNTLANLRSLVQIDARMAETMIDQLIVYLRSALAASREESTTLRNEFAQLRAYLDIMSLRMGPRLSYRLELPAELEQVSIPPMLLQPLVENAIKHGIEPKIGDGSIDIEARELEDAIEISVTDSGLGMPAENAPSSSYGLEHVRERLQAVYGARASLSLARQHPHGVRAIVRIPR
jgi:signal transduction histidine kinase